MYQYTANNKKMAEGDLIGLGVNPKFALEEMNFAKQQNHQTDGKEYKQIVFSFDRDIQLSWNTITEIAGQIGCILATEYQVLARVHYNTDNIHAHYMINTVNVNTGNRYRQKYSVNHYKREVNKILGEYDLRPIKIRRK